jgi:transcriptional/translational regulatory protein YebC/TACO1
MFDHSTILAFKGQDEEAVLEALMMADVDVTDIETEAELVTIFAPNTDYGKAKQALADSFGELTFEVDEIQFLPQNTTPVTGEDAETLDKFLDMLNDLDDVQNVYDNVDA